MQMIDVVFESFVAPLRREFFEVVDEHSQIAGFLRQRNDRLEISIVRQIVAELRLEHRGWILPYGLPLKLSAIKRIGQHLLENFFLGVFYVFSLKNPLAFGYQAIDLAGIPSLLVK